MNKANLGHLKNLLGSTKGDLGKLKKNLEDGHKELRELTEKTETNYENQLKQVNAIPQTRKSVDKYLRGLKILINEEDRKKDIALSSIDSAIETIDSVIQKIEDANKLTTKKEEEKRGQIIQEITGAIPSLIEFIQTVFTNSNYLVHRANTNAYLLHEQPILKDQGIQFAEPQYYLQGIQSTLGNPKDAGSLSSQINKLKTDVGKSGNILANEKSKGFSFSKQNLEAQQKIDKQKAYEAALRGKLPNIQESELSDAVKASISFIKAQEPKIDSGEQSDNEREIKKKIEDTFGVLAPDIIKYAASGNKKKNITSGKELYQQIKQTRGFGDRPEIDSIGEEMKARFLKNREAKFKPRDTSAFETTNLENVQPKDESGGGSQSPIEEVKPKVEYGGGSQSPIEEVKPKVEYGGGSQSPGEVSDEMLKIIEQAVFNGTARAFSQFSNSPISAPSEFSDSAIDKIGNTVYEAMKKALDYYSASPALNMVLFGIDPSVMKLLKDELGGLSSTGGGTGDMDKLAEELRKSRESNENLAKMQEARRKKAAAEKRKKDKEAEKEKKRIADPNSPESIAKKKKEADAAERAQKRKDKEDPNSLENIAKAEEKKRKEEEKKAKEDKAKLKAEREADPFRKRLKTIFKEGEQELTFLYAKTDAFAGWIPGFNDAILKARKSALETLREGYEAFDKKYAASGSAFKGMWASLKAMYSVSPFTVIVAGLTTIGILLGKTIFNAAQKVNTQIKEIAAELGTSNRQSYEMFKNAMNAQTQFENLHASLRDVMDAQKGILGDSGILLRTNDKALSAIADNAKNIGLSVESAGAFYENLRMKGAGDTEANNVMTASLELADKRGFSPQSIVDDIAQNAEFASKYFSKIKTDSKSAHRNLIETNIQVKNLGLNFQKASKMTQHLLSFEQSITAEVEASVALGTHVDIGKARELLLQDDVAGAMTEMMNAIPGGYEGFQKQDFAQRQLSANLLGLEVSELERSLYLREKIKLSNSEDLELAMRHDDYLKKIAGTNDELYRTELNKVQAAERYNTSIEQLSVSFRYALAPVLEAVVPVVDLLASAIHKFGELVKKYLGGITGANSDAAIGGGGIKTPDMYQMGGGALMATVMGAKVLEMIKGPVGKQIGGVIGKAREGYDTLTGTLGTKTNPMYVVSLGGSNQNSGGNLLDNLTDGIDTGTSKNKKGRLTKKGLPDRRFKANRLPSTPTIKPGLFKSFENNLKNFKAGNLIKSVIKTGGFTSAIFAGLDYMNRKESGQSTAQAAAGSISGALGSLGGAAFGAAIGTMLLPGVGSVVGGLLGAYFGNTASTSIVDSHFDKNKSSSFTGGYGIYAGMGLNTAGSIVANNKPKATGTPVETSMVDMTPTTFKSPTNSLSTISPNYGMTSNIARESVMINKVSKSVASTALVQSTLKEKEKTDDALIKEAQEQTKLMQEMIKRLNQPALAFFNDEGRKQTASYIRVKGTP
jgi:hypothetical protein